MSIATYSDLQASVASWLHRSDLTSVIPDFIMLGEKRIYRHLRVRSMESALSATISSGVISVPSDYIDLKSSYVDGSVTSPLSRTSVQDLYNRYPIRSSEGKPIYIAREGSSFIFGPYPDSTYAIKGIYYALPTAVATSANAVFTANPDLYLAATLAEAFFYLKDETRFQLWSSKTDGIITSLNAQDTNEYGSGAGLAVVAA